MTTYSPRYFDIDQDDHACVAHFRESNLMGTSLADSASRDLQNIISTTDSEGLVVDFENVKMISSSMIAALVKTRERSLNAGLWFRMSGMSSALRHIFQTLHLDGTVFEIHETLEEAVDSIGTGPTIFERTGKHADPEGPCSD